MHAHVQKGHKHHAAAQLGPDTTLTAELPDSAALFGAMARLEALGLDLIDVNRLDDRGSTPSR